MTSDADQSLFDIAALTDAYRRGSLSPVEIVALVLERAEACRPTLNAFNAIAHDTAMTQARRAEARYRRADPVGAFEGVPITVKDIIPTEGIRTTFGSPAFASYVPNADAVSVRRMRQAGAILIGKTTTPEFACKQTTNSKLSGITRNPWRLALTPGGSSGGSSSSIAAGIGHLSLVTDGGGSARLPAACTGIVGLKPTFAAIPFDTALDAFGGFGHIGLMARNVCDVAIALAVARGPDAADPHSLAGGGAPSCTELRGKRPLSGLRVGWREHLHNELIDPLLSQAFHRALKSFEALGAFVGPINGEIEFATRDLADAAGHGLGRTLRGQSGSDEGCRPGHRRGDTARRVSVCPRASGRAARPHAAFPTRAAMVRGVGRRRDARAHAATPACRASRVGTDRSRGPSGRRHPRGLGAASGADHDDGPSGA